jgi:membrane fusion protein, multidrug efflux system
LIVWAVQLLGSPRRFLRSEGLSAGQTLATPVLLVRLKSFVTLRKEGTPVEKGAPLITLDDSVDQAELHEASAKRLLAEQSNQRVTELFSRKIASASSGRDRKQSRRRERCHELAKAHIGRTKIVAPFAGIVGLRPVSVGEYITSGQPLVGLDAIEQIKVDFKVPEKHLPTVHTASTSRSRSTPIPGRPSRVRFTP